jgi:hypothetical protein
MAVIGYSLGARDSDFKIARNLVSAMTRSWRFGVNTNLTFFEVKAQGVGLWTSVNNFLPQDLVTDVSANPYRYRKTQDFEKLPGDTKHMAQLFLPELEVRDGREIKFLRTVFPITIAQSCRSFSTCWRIVRGHF